MSGLMGGGNQQQSAMLKQAATQAGNQAAQSAAGAGGLQPFGMQPMSQQQQPASLFQVWGQLMNNKNRGATIAPGTYIGPSTPGSMDPNDLSDMDKGATS